MCDVFGPRQGCLFMNLMTILLCVLGGAACGAVDASGKPAVYDIVCVADATTEERAALVSLQGLVNRSVPELYLLSTRDGTEAAWVKWYGEYGLAGTELGLEAAFKKHAGAAKGYVVYDPALPDTLNIAIILAGLDDAIVCGPSTEERMKGLGLACLHDLRGRWVEKLAAYQWAVDTLLKRSDLKVMATFEQGAAPEPRPDMDYVVAHRGFCMGLSINEADYAPEAALWDRVQSAAPRGAMMLGWHTSHDGEATHVNFGSRHSVWVYCGAASNMSFHQHVAARKPFVQDHCAQAECDPQARYVTVTLSDGDSWHSMADMQKKFWQHPRRGEVPLGWEIAPVFSRVGPAILEYYYATRTPNDYFVGGPSGIAYNYLSGYRDWAAYLEDTARIMQDTSLRAIWVINRKVRHLPGGVIEHRLKNGPIEYTRAQMEGMGGLKDKYGADWTDPQMVDRYIRGIPEALGFFQGWERIPGEGNRWVEGRPWMPTGALVRRDLDAVLKEVEQAAGVSRPAFIPTHVNCYDADMDVVVELVRRLTDLGYTVVRPDRFLCLAQDANRRGLCGR